MPGGAANDGIEATCGSSPVSVEEALVVDALVRGGVMSRSTGRCGRRLPVGVRRNVAGSMFSLSPPNAGDFISDSIDAARDWVEEGWCG